MEIFKKIFDLINYVRHVHILIKHSGTSSKTVVEDIEITVHNIWGNVKHSHISKSSPTHYENTQ